MRDQGIETIAELMDTEWTRFPPAIASEIHRAATAAGLRAADEAEPSAELNLSAEELEERLWDRVIDTLTDSTARAFNIRGTVELEAHEVELLKRSARWQQVAELGLLNMDSSESKPWYAIIADTPPPLVALSLGFEYSGYYDIGHCNPVLAAVAKTLQRLHSLGDTADVEPLTLPKLESLEIDAATLPDREFFEACELPKLAKLEARGEEGVAESLISLLALGSLKEARLGSRLKVSASLFDTIRTGRDEPLQSFDITDDNEPTATDEEENCLTRGDVHVSFVADGETVELAQEHRCVEAPSAPGDWELENIQLSGITVAR